MVLGVSVDFPHAEYREVIRQPFKGKIQAYWNDDDADPDGYGLGDVVRNFVCAMGRIGCVRSGVRLVNGIASLCCEKIKKSG